MLARTAASFLNSEKSRASAAGISYAISVEMIVGHELDTVGQLVSVWSGDEIQSDLSPGVGLNLRRRLISLPVGKVDSVVNGAINREFGDVGETGMIILKTHRKLLVV